MSFPGRINEYRCDRCKRVMVTVDRDQGDTQYLHLCLFLNPIRIGNEITGLPCGGRAVSALYDCDQNQIPMFEWHKPGPDEVANANPYPRWLAETGHLWLRPIKLPRNAPTNV